MDLSWHLQLSEHIWKSTDLFCVNVKGLRDEKRIRAGWKRKKKKKKTYKNSCVSSETEFIWLRDLWTLTAKKERMPQSVPVSWHLPNKSTRPWNSSKNVIFFEMFHTWGRRENVQKLVWALSNLSLAKIWKHLHIILKTNLECLIHGENWLSNSISPAINLPLAGWVCRN